MKNNHKFRFSGAKGYYIVLILCAAAIGISGYLYYRNATGDDPQLQDPTSDVINPGSDSNVPAVGTQPGNSSDDQLNQPDASDPGEDSGRKPLQVCSPLEGKTICDYAVECLAYNETTRDWRTHDGIDISAEAGTAVRAAAAGTVYTTYYDETMGMTVVIRHDGGYVTVYSSLDEDVSVKAGDQISMGQTIGTVGNTALLETAIGDHLHFSVTLDDKSVDPEEFLSMNE